MNFIYFSKLFSKMGCCVQRGKLDGVCNLESEFFMLNALPTYENIEWAYLQLSLPEITMKVLKHRKEQMILMIINMLRVKPKIFLNQMEHLKAKCEQRQKARNVVFVATDVEASINLLQTAKPIQELQISD